MKTQPILALAGIMALLGAFLLAGCAHAQAGHSSGVQISQDDGKLRVEINGKLFTEYLLQRRAAALFLSAARPG